MPAPTAANDRAVIEEALAAFASEFAPVFEVIKKFAAECRAAGLLDSCRRTAYASWFAAFSAESASRPQKRSGRLYYKPGHPAARPYRCCFGEHWHIGRPSRAHHRRRR